MADTRITLIVLTALLIAFFGIRIVLRRDSKELIELWERWLDSLASEGGHIFLWTCGILFGVACYELGYDVLGDRICASAMTGLGIALKTANSNLQRRDASQVSQTMTIKATGKEGE